MDYLTKHGATVLARSIRDYWMKRYGIAIETVIKTEDLPGQPLPIYTIRSNIPGIFREGN